MKTIFLTINLCFCTGRPSSLKPMAHITPALRTPSSQLLPFFFPTCASKETSVYLIMILISLLVPPTCKKCTPHFSKCGGYEKIRESRAAPPALLPPWRSVVIIHSSRIIISSLKLLYFWMLLFVVTTKLRTSTSLFAGYFCLYFARIAGCLCIYAINEYNALLRIVRLMLGSCRGSRMPRRHTE